MSVVLMMLQGLGMVLFGLTFLVVATVIFAIPLGWLKDKYGYVESDEDREAGKA